jgi:hypothetical protein
VEIDYLPPGVILDRYVPGRSIDCPNIDCEGHDLAVLRRLDWTGHRPTVFLVEDLEEFEAAADPARHPGAIRALPTEQGMLSLRN